MKTKENRPILAAFIGEWRLQMLAVGNAEFLHGPLVIMIP